jgi:hypothetical protein
LKRLLIMAILVLTLVFPMAVMAAPWPGLTLSAVPSSVTITRSALATSGEMDARVAAGLTPIAVTLANTGTTTSPVRINPIGAPANLQLWAKDTSNNWFDINVTGWIDSAGVAIPTGYTATTLVYAVSDLVAVPDTYNITVNVAEVTGGAIVASASGSVTVIASTILVTNVVPETLLFSVSPTTLNFGTVVVGSISGEQTFRVTNLGTLPLKVTASVTGPLYVSCMQLNYGSGWVVAQGAQSGTITVPTAPGNNFVDVRARIVSPTSAHIGNAIPGSLTFIATMVP